MIRQSSIRKFGAIWGVSGVVALLAFAVYRLVPFATDLLREKLSMWEIGILIVWCFIMAYSEGYKAFGQQFAPRVVARAQYLSRHASWRRIVLAPLFCVGYFGAPIKRIVLSTALFAGIVVLIVVVHFIPQPWRGIIDVGVVFGLACGIFYLLLYSVRAIRQRTYVTDPEVV